MAGYDDYKIVTEHMHPTLTSVDLPYGAMGVRAADKLMRLITGTTKPNEPNQELVSGPVVWRESVKTRDTNVTPFISRRKET